MNRTRYFSIAENDPARARTLFIADMERAHISMAGWMKADQGHFIETEEGRIDVEFIGNIPGEVGCYVNILGDVDETKFLNTVEIFPTHPYITFADDGQQ